MNPDIDYITLTDFSSIYDVYSVNLEGFEFYTVSDFTSIEKLASLNSKLRLIDPVNIDIKAAVILEVKNTIFENFRLGIKIRNIKLNVRDVQLEFLIHFLNYYNKLNEKLNKEVESFSKSKSVVISTTNVVDPQELQRLKKEEEKFLEKKQEVKEGEKQKSGNRPKKQKNFSSKFVLRIEFILQRIELNLLKSISEKEEALLKKHNGLSDDKMFKIYLNFVLNNMNFLLAVSDQKEVQLNFKLFNMFFFDSDFVYKYDNQNIRYSENLVNSEFSVRSLYTYLLYNYMIKFTLITLNL